MSIAERAPRIEYVLLTIGELSSGLRQTLGVTQDIPNPIGGAAPVAFADLEATSPTGVTRHVVGGVLPQPFAGLVIAQYAHEPGFYLFYCQSDWTVVTDTWHETREDAEAQAASEYNGVKFTDL